MLILMLMLMIIDHVDNDGDLDDDVDGDVDVDVDVNIDNMDGVFSVPTLEISYMWIVFLLAKLFGEGPSCLLPPCLSVQQSKEEDLILVKGAIRWQNIFTGSTSQLLSMDLSFLVGVVLPAETFVPHRLLLRSLRRETLGQLGEC